MLVMLYQMVQNHNEKSDCIKQEADNDLIPETAEGKADSTGIVNITALYGVLYLGCTAENHEDI